ncbi:hypothetical protein P153DRAFT_388555 [Dothidotthia symphoricarpi CBS 119687]|uniref:Uncharacterized protein n=1 Tax=Dothidotthia symphoricarpi CBS 119687 TaxID=1392245 RepID=A0A6A6A5R5_9PLEO|nr:uncharacterized protein P153DRAFT_388555 [Dothidotthia symphoricarpi CBS 119687]KAF2126515.1 hypothetical protein P153DRAFT_388555 [Dothidotthia symphoricarpi CBS 119687]
MATVAPSALTCTWPVLEALGQHSTAESCALSSLAVKLYYNRRAQASIDSACGRLDIASCCQLRRLAENVRASAQWSSGILTSQPPLPYRPCMNYTKADPTLTYCALCHPPLQLAGRTAAKTSSSLSAGKHVADWPTAAVFRSAYVRNPNPLDAAPSQST